MPIFGAASEEGDELEVRAFDAVDVNGGEIAAAGGGDVESEAMRLIGGEQILEGLLEEIFNLVFASDLVFGPELAEEIDDLIFFEVDALYFVIGEAAFDVGPGTDSEGAADGVAHVLLLKDFREAGAFLTLF